MVSGDGRFRSDINIVVDFLAEGNRKRRKPFVRLAQMLMEGNKSDDRQRVISDLNYRKQLF